MSQKKILCCMMCKNNNNIRCSSSVYFSKGNIEGMKQKENIEFTSRKHHTVIWIAVVIFLFCTNIPSKKLYVGSFTNSRSSKLGKLNKEKWFPIVDDRTNNKFQQLVLSGMFQRKITLLRFFQPKQNRFIDSTSSSIQLNTALTSSNSNQENYTFQKRSWSTTTTKNSQKMIVDISESSYLQPTTTTSTSSSSTSSRRKQMRWIAQSVEKLLNDEIKQQQQNNVTFYMDTVQYNQYCTDLVDALYLLSSARSTSQVTDAGRKIEVLLENGFLCQQDHSIDILERIVKSTAMAGLLQPIALNVTDYIIKNRMHIPSTICQDSLFSTLRKVGRVRKMESLLYDMASLLATKSQNDPINSTTTTERRISLVSFNMYLAALCDAATSSATSDKSKIGSKPKTTTNTNPNNANRKSESIDKAWKLIQNSDKKGDNDNGNIMTTPAERLFGIVPDSVSYATVIQTAAHVGNQTLVDSIWKEMQKQNIETNIVSYNARLRILTNNGGGGKTSSIATIERDRKMLQIWTEITDPTNSNRIVPDRYTIDSILLPFVRSGRVRDLERVLNQFVQSNSETVVSEAFSAYLLTLVQGDQLGIAQRFMETYILPSVVVVSSSSFSTNIRKNHAASMRWVRPSARHFNVLLEGYRSRYVSNTKLLSSFTNSIDHACDKTDTTNNLVPVVPLLVLEEMVFQPAWKLYDAMCQPQSSSNNNNNKNNQHGCRPDAYTITIMMGLCRTTTELSKLLCTAIVDFSIELHTVVLRAALTAYGDLGDASSAVWIFGSFASKATIREWNVLVGALATGAKINGGNHILVPSKSVAATLMSSTNVDLQQQSSSSSLSMEASLLSPLENVSIVDSVMFILDLMNTTSSSTSSCNNNHAVLCANSQTYCIAASAFQYNNSIQSSDAIRLFRSASKQGIPADGRFVNAIFRCYGDNVNAVLHDWKHEIRPRCMSFMNNNNGSRNARSSQPRGENNNLFPAYNGILYVCGRAFRPDVALRVVYAMKKEGLEPTEVSLNSYKSGKRIRNANHSDTTTMIGPVTRVAQKLHLLDAYESLLEVECTKYDTNDNRRVGESRVRIIL